MKIFGAELAVRALAVIAAIAAACILALVIPSCVHKHSSQAAQARVDASQAKAAQDSAGDAIGTVAASGARESASEDLTRSNDRAIRAAPGASVRVDAGVNLEGRRALCRRASYRDDPKCAMFKGVR